MTDTANKTNLELSEVEAVPAPEVVNLTMDDWLSDWPTGEDPVNQDAIEKKLKEVAAEALKNGEA